MNQLGNELKAGNKQKKMGVLVTSEWRQTESRNSGPANRKRNITLRETYFSRTLHWNPLSRSLLAGIELVYAGYTGEYG